MGTREAVVPGVSRTASVRQRQRRRDVEGYLVISPWLVGFFLFTVGPMLASLMLSFMTYDLLSPPRWSGLANLHRMANDRLFGLSLYNTAYYAFAAVPAQLVVAFVLALMLNMKVAGVNIFRTLYYLPTVTPAVASVILWVWILNPEYGLANTLLGYVGIPKQAWLWDPVLSKPSFVLMSLWGVGWQMIIFLGGLQGVPIELHEAAMMDGAGQWRRLLNVTLPVISPVTFFNLTMGIIRSFQTFTGAYIATQGGPINTTLFYVLLVFRQAFENWRMGYACVLAWVLVILLLLFTLIQFRLSGRWVYYESPELK